MTSRPWLGGLVLLTGLLVVGWQVPVRAQEGQKWPWKLFDPGAKPVFQVLYTLTHQDITVNNQKTKQIQEQTYYLKWTPAAKKERIDGKEHWVVSVQIIGVKTEIDIGGNKITYDSTEENQPRTQLGDFFKALVDSDLTFYITEDFQVRRIDKADELRKKLSAANPQMETLLKGILSDVALRGIVEPTWAAYPPKGEFKAQQQWEKTTEMDLGPLGSYNYRNTYTCAADPFKIKIRSTLEYKGPAKGEGLPFKITKAKLNGLTAKEGEAVFDRNKGRFAKTLLQIQMEGELTIDIGGMETTVQLSQSQETQMRLQDTDPVAEIKKNRKN